MIMSELFVEDIGNSGEFKRKKYTHRLEPVNDVQWNTCKQLLTTLHTFLPKRCLVCCLRPSRKQRLRSKAFA